MNIGNALREIRFKKRLKQQDVAAKAKISQTYLSQIEGGAKENPSKAVVSRLCKIYDVPVAVVFWMALEEKDIKPSRKADFKRVKQPMDNLIAEFIY